MIKFQLLGFTPTNDEVVEAISLEDDEESLVRMFGSGVEAFVFYLEDDHMRQFEQKFGINLRRDLNWQFVPGYL